MLWIMFFVTERVSLASDYIQTELNFNATSEFTVYRQRFKQCVLDIRGLHVSWLPRPEVRIPTTSTKEAMER